jgi:hypothetical protein
MIELKNETETALYAAAYALEAKRRLPKGRELWMLNEAEKAVIANKGDLFAEDVVKMHRKNTAEIRC